ncbi:MAG: TlpA disulfide reductase family protein [Beijerinckiaceae bacterium]
MKQFALIGALIALIPGGACAGDLQPFASGSWAEILKAHAGRPTIIHFWGLTCGPCRIEMANWGKLIARRHGFDFITIDTDMVPGPPEQVEAFLSNAGLPASGEAWRFDDGFAEKLYFQVDPKWQGEIPMTVFLGRDGRTERIVGAVEPKTVDLWLDGQEATAH